ncbi:protein of unknown function [Pseudotevenvirus RB43]|uniref:Uncharacterized protein n=2 Tax=Pseudotevenvirus RB43 TaxID=115991 RepID=Q56BR5_9CAUD|nr:hypothetical protein RB43ORF133c [Escherichia phage RB43]AAX78655.1 hypothetical protein RB43ORF133c [Escherichia phage RB43]CCK73981.1 protein of unknown function [Pseudotevenvirus RB43]CCL97598.1 protein of unknown function [Pseudotevenvirus RB43]
MKHSRSVIMGDVVNINGNDYYVAEINTKGNREIMELDIVKPVPGRSLTIEMTHNTKTGEDVVTPVLSKLPVFYCDKTKRWKMK